MSATQPNAAAPAKVRATPLVVSAHRAFLWLLGTAVMAMLAYYFIGVDQGATSVLGNNTYVHEFVHDARHLLGFPCH